MVLSSSSHVTTTSTKTATKSGLAESYAVSVNTLMKWLRAAGHETYGQRKTLLPREVAGIYAVLGPPEQAIQMQVYQV